MKSVSNKADYRYNSIFKPTVQLNIKIVQLIFLNFLSLYSDLAEMYSILNTEEGNIFSWQSWVF